MLRSSLFPVAGLVLAAPPAPAAADAAAGPAAFGDTSAAPARYAGRAATSVYVPMRDGVRLAAEVVLPEPLATGDRLPALVVQTRYWRQRELRAPFRWFMTPERLNAYHRDWEPFLVTHGYVIVVVDVRGTGASFGTWPYPWAEDSVRDMHDLVDWIVAQPWSSGRVGGYGISYLGTTAELLGACGHPAVKAVVPMFSHPDPFTDIAFPGGIFNERFIHSWGDFDRTLDNNEVPPEFGLLGRLAIAGVKRVDADADGLLLADAVRQHVANAHAFSLARPIDYRDQPPAGLQVSADDIAVHRFGPALAASGTASFGFGSWMDAGTADAVLRRFVSFNNAAWAAIGAWEHGGRFDASPYRAADGPAKPPLPQQWTEMLRFFDATLQADGPPPAKTLFYYTLGEERWHATPVWPPAGTVRERWYLAPAQALATTAPAADGDDRYTVDFDATTGDTNRWWEMGGLHGDSVSYPGRRQAAAHLLVYTSAPLAEDTEISGYPVVDSWLTSTHADGAFFVYLEDVDERGEVTYVTEGELRALHRKVSAALPPYALQVPYHSFRAADASPLVPGEPAQLTFGLNPVSVLIRRGHRLRLGLAGQDAGTFRRLPAEGTPTWTVLRDRSHASSIRAAPHAAAIGRVAG